MLTTWVRKDRRIYQDSDCLLCGTNYGICQGEHRAHRSAICKACGTPQCWTNGLSHGTCSVCLVGFLDAFSSKKCGYAHCGKEAVAEAPRVRQVCKDHLARAGLVERIAKHLQDRDKEWNRIDYNLSDYPVK